MKKLIAVAVLSLLTSPAWATNRTVTLSLPTMNCPVCPITVKKALAGVEGVSRAEIDFDARRATVTFDDTKTNAAALMNATRNAGYPSTLTDNEK